MNNRLTITKILDHSFDIDEVKLQDVYEEIEHYLTHHHNPDGLFFEVEQYTDYSNIVIKYERKETDTEYEERINKETKGKMQTLKRLKLSVEMLEKELNVDNNNQEEVNKDD